MNRARKQVGPPCRFAVCARETRVTNTRFFEVARLLTRAVHV